MRFQDRTEAGEKLAARLLSWREKQGVVLAIPRGGVTLGEIVAKRLSWPLGVVITKKIGLPGNEELAIGAVAETGKPVWDKKLSTRYGLTKEILAIQEQKARNKVKNYIKKFRNGIPLRSRIGGVETVIVVDDGIATGQTIEAAINCLRLIVKKQSQIILAVPVCASDSAKRLRKIVDEFVCLHVTSNFWAVGQFYLQFDQVDDKEVIQILSGYQ